MCNIIPIRSNDLIWVIMLTRVGSRRPALNEKDRNQPFPPANPIQHKPGWHDHDSVAAIVPAFDEADRIGPDIEVCIQTAAQPNRIRLAVPPRLRIVVAIVVVEEPRLGVRSSGLPPQRLKKRCGAFAAVHHRKPSHAEQ